MYFNIWLFNYSKNIFWQCIPACLTIIIAYRYNLWIYVIFIKADANFWRETQKIWIWHRHPVFYKMCLEILAPKRQCTFHFIYCNNYKETTIFITEYLTYTLLIKYTDFSLWYFVWKKSLLIHRMLYLYVCQNYKTILFITYGIESMLLRYSIHN